MSFEMHIHMYWCILSMYFSSFHQYTHVKKIQQKNRKKKIGTRNWILRVKKILCFYGRNAKKIYRSEKVVNFPGTFQIFPLKFTIKFPHNFSITLTQLSWIFISFFLYKRNSFFLLLKNIFLNIFFEINFNEKKN